MPRERKKHAADISPKFTSGRLLGPRHRRGRYYLRFCYQIRATHYARRRLKVSREELVSPDEVNFDANVFLITKAKAKALRSRSQERPIIEDVPKPEDKQPSGPEPDPEPKPGPTSQTVTLNLRGSIPPEIWNRLGTKLIPKLRSGSDLKAEVSFSVTLDGKAVGSFEAELRQILEDLGIEDLVKIKKP